MGKAAIYRLTDVVNGNHIDECGLEELFEDYRWISCLDIHNKPWSFKEFQAKLEELSQKKGDGDNQAPRNIEDLSTESMITLQNIVKLAQRAAYIKDLRTDYRCKGVYYARKGLFNEIARRAKLNLSDLSYILEAEIIEFLNNGTLFDCKSIEERQNGFVIYFDENQNIVCRSGRDAEKAMTLLGIRVRKEITWTF